MQKFYVLSSLNAGLFFRKQVNLKSLIYFRIEENIYKMILSSQIMNWIMRWLLLIETIALYTSIKRLELINLNFKSMKNLNEIISPWNFLPSRVIFYRTPWRHKRLVYAYLAKSSADWNSGNWVSSLFRTITWHFSSIAK